MADTLSLLQRDAFAYTSLTSLCAEYFPLYSTAEIESLLNSLSHTKTPSFLTTESDLTVSLLAVMKIVLAQRIGGNKYNKILTPYVLRCKKYINQNFNVIPFLHKDKFDQILLLKSHLSTRARNILNYITPFYLLLYITNEEHLQQVITASQKYGSKTYLEILVFAAKVKNAINNASIKTNFKETDNTSCYEQNTLLLNKYERLLSSLSVRSRHIILQNCTNYCDFLSKTTKDFILMRSCGKKSIKEIINAQNEFKVEYQRVFKMDFVANNKCVSPNNEANEGQINDIEITQEQDIILSKLYSDILASLSVRSRNVLLKCCNSYHDFLSRTRRDIVMLRNCGKASISEISEAQAKFTIEFQQLLSLEEDKLSSFALKCTFTFLSDDDAEFCCSYHREKCHFPMFFLLERLLLTSNDKFCRLFVQHHGVGCKSLTLQELAQRENLTRERVRQLLISIPPHILNFLSDDAWKNYHIVDVPYFSEYSIHYSQVIIDEQLTCLSFNTFLELICRTSEYSTIEINGRLAAVSKNFAKCFDFAHSIEDLEDTLKAKIYRNTEISIDTFINPYILVYNDLCHNVIDLYRELLVFLGYELNDNNIVLHRNKVDLEDALYNILNREGYPLHIEQLFRLFKQEFPNHKYQSSSSIRPTLLRSNRICSQGKSSTYALCEWNLFSGSRRDYANSILQESPVPIPKKELISRLQLRFPESSDKSLASTISLSDNYEAYEGNLIGLLGKKYPDEFIKVDNFDTRKPFETRINDLILFFKKYHYSPQYNGNSEEKSLWRWIYNTKTGRTIISNEQKHLFDSVFERFAEYCFTGDELEFSKNCERFVAFVYEFMELPTKESDPDLTKWFNNIRRQAFKDKRKELKEHFFQELSDYGFVF